LRNTPKSRSKGEQDDFAAFDTVAADQKIEFVHPLTGITYRALNRGTRHRYAMVKEAQRRKDRWQAYQHCVDDPSDATGVCECTYQSQEVRLGYYVCPPRFTEPCTPSDRTLSAEYALESLEKQVELMNNVRLFHNVFEYNLY